MYTQTRFSVQQLADKRFEATINVANIRRFLRQCRANGHASQQVNLLRRVF